MVSIQRISAKRYRIGVRVEMIGVVLGPRGAVGYKVESHTDLGWGGKKLYKRKIGIVEKEKRIGRIETCDA